MISKATPVGIFAAVLAACSAAATQTPAPRPASFHAVVDSIVSSAMRETQWGIEVWDQKGNQVLYSHDAQRKFIPASNTKLVATSTAMGLLGPDFRYETPIMVTGAVGDTAPNALIIKASGDPTWSARFFGSDFAILDSIADSLSAHGIKRIAGDLIIDASIFAPERVHGSWEIGDLPWYYAAPTAAFAVGEAAVRMIVTATDVRFMGAAPAPFVSRVRTDSARASANIDVDYEAWPDTLVVTGSIAPNDADSSWIAQPDPERYAAQALVAALAQKQIEVTGSIRIIRDPAQLSAFSMRTVTTIKSPPLKDIIAGILRPSQNWITEQLLKTMGALKGSGGTWREGLRVERRYLIDVAHIDSLEFSLNDGSGLSAQNVVAPHAFVSLLEYNRHQPWGDLYRLALPTPGLRGGTLSSRLAGLETRLSAKTGTIANVNSLSGYVRGADGRDLTFSILTNGSGRASSDVRRAIDVIVQAMARETSW